MAMAAHLLLLFPLLLLIVVHGPLPSSCADTATLINLTTPLLGPSGKLVSAGGRFAVGFFSNEQLGATVNETTSGSSSRYYLGIWYDQPVNIYTVWIANGAAPIPGPCNGCLLSISPSTGDLVLTADHQQGPVWSTDLNLAAASNASTEAVILDSGSLVLRDARNASRVLWQSMDHPTNTWLPGGKLIRNNTDGVSQRLYSWSSKVDPSPGLFSMVLDPSGSSAYLLQWNKTVTYWTSGVWDNDTSTFSELPEMMNGYAYNYRFVNNPEETYFSYSTGNSPILYRIVVDYNGQGKLFIWPPGLPPWSLSFYRKPSDQCQVHRVCGPFGDCNSTTEQICGCLPGFQSTDAIGWGYGDYSTGCSRKTPLKCESGSAGAELDQDKFYSMNNTRLPDNGQKPSIIAASPDSCQSACLSNCSCTAYSFDAAAANCTVWYGQLINFQSQYNGNGWTLSLRLAASELSLLESGSNNKNNNKGPVVNTGLVIGISAAIFCAILAAAVALLCKKRMNRAMRMARMAGTTVVAFRYVDLQHITRNFSQKLGSGAFGSVFKGVLPGSSTAIAVKKLDGRGQGEKQFRAEVSTIGTIHHVNLVRLLGFCSEGVHRLLVYEFMHNGSLDCQLFLQAADHSTALNWNTRYQIALGTAKGLEYLHEKCRFRIIHCDIKPENILLDESFNPKISDFGLAKLLGRDFSRVMTTMRGTRGYIAPEWILGVPITAKADVFSYGMVLFELISGRRNRDHNTENGVPVATFFPAHAAIQLLEGNVQGLLDPRLDGDANYMEVERMCKVALWCIQDSEDSRPTMGQVVQILEGFLDNFNMPPMPHGLMAFGENPDNIKYFSTGVTDSHSSSQQKQSSSSSGSQL